MKHNLAFETLQTVYFLYQDKITKGVINGFCFTVLEDTYAVKVDALRHDEMLKSLGGSKRKDYLVVFKDGWKVLPEDKLFYDVQELIDSILEGTE